MTKPVLSIIVPVYNEEGNLKLLYSKFMHELENKIKKPYEIIFCDDGSTDNSWDIILALNAENENVKGLSFARNFGHQKAVLAALEVASGDCVLSMDADLQHPPELIKTFYDIFNQGYDVVAGVRDPDEKISFVKKAFAKLYYYIFPSITGVDAVPRASDFRMMSRSSVDFLVQLKENNKFLRALIPWSGFKTYYFPYKARRRHSGKPTFKFLQSWKMGVEGIASFSNVPLYVSIFIGIIFAILSFIYGLYAVYQKLILQNVPPGWTDLIASTLFIGGLQLIIIGVLGFYIGQIKSQVIGRPDFIISKKLGFDDDQ